MSTSGKNKIVTFSFDDGVTQDRRLVALFDRYGLKGTFNLNSEKFGVEGAARVRDVTVTHNKIAPEEVATLYAGHEVAAHTLTHPHLDPLSDEELVREVDEDRKNLERLSGREVVGFAYPFGDLGRDGVAPRLIERHTPIRYCRTVRATCAFDMPKDPWLLDPTVHAIDFDRLEALCDAFIALQTDETKMFYIWGHAYEFDHPGYWDRFERFCARIAGRDDIAYLTNREALGV